MKEDLNLHSALKTSCTVLFCAIANSALADPLDSSSFINAPPDSFWTQKYMFGDWGGERTRLEQMGITFYGEYRDDFQGNATGTDKNGNERDHSVNFGIFYLNLDVDLMKLADIAGEFFFSAVWQYGGNLSDRYLNAHTSTSSIAGTNSECIDQLWYRAHALKKRTWGDLTALWVAHDIRDAIMDFIGNRQIDRASRWSSRIVAIANKDAGHMDPQVPCFWSRRYSRAFSKRPEASSRQSYFGCLVHWAIFRKPRRQAMVFVQT
jgi:hypothetical protein